MDVYKLKRPKSTGNLDKILNLIKSGANILQFVGGTNKPEYLYWDRAKFKPRPKDLSAEEFWTLVKFMRMGSPSRISTIVRNKEGVFFTWQPLPGLDYFLHQVDMGLGGALESSSGIEDKATRRKFISRGILEEAIASSQLEGANTTRRVAKRMLAEQRKPVNRSEQMIHNNYRAMLYIEEKLQYDNLTMKELLNLHATLVQDTVDDDEIGRLRRDADRIVVTDVSSNVVYHVPPPERLLKRELKRFIEYANDDSSKFRFVHPLIKAIILHFWVGYLHPFSDGNGRLARTIFYWYLLRKGYWAFSYLPLSRVIKNSPAQYRDAYIYSEQDDSDLTYFIDYIVRKIEQARREFDLYVKRKMSENRKIAEIARDQYHLNDRQIQLLYYLHRNQQDSTSIKAHAHIYGVSRMTARKDLEMLEKEGFLSSRKVGRERPFLATKKTSSLFP